MDQQRPVFPPYFGLIVGAVFVSTAAVLVKLSSAPAEVVAFYRLFLAVVLMTPFVFPYFKELKRLERRQWVYLLVSGLFLALHFVLWFESLNYTSVASSVVLVTLQPLFTFAGAYVLFRERMTIKALAAGILAIGGSVLIFWGDFRFGGEAIVGNALALLAAAMVSGYWLCGQHLRQCLSIMAYTYVVYGAAALFILAYVMAQNSPFLDYPAGDWWLFLALALFPTLLGHSIFNWAVKWVGASVISVTVLFEPIGASILAYLILGETLSVTQIGGGMMILSGIYLFLRFKTA
ncbi:drug/metabolite transporter (DMT)-like permease [Caldalkalibacillus uzonensis]|uniref:Drug/metabolite transporter (DMT)-like permease n=1 Tax=Caldalkalibacillus uzonensis TaxID=353224 RepID=A0ABU0CPF3_9BACI|nr:DMT family transporter [Caldalkalibacillus uzonensis]MDQ0337968.1 drug/metabolite transporter (DMT)-like permease [Caldalkalibacillus uzonensis]